MTVPRAPAHDALNRRSVIAILRKRAESQRQVTISPDMALWVAGQGDGHTVDYAGSQQAKVPARRPNPTGVARTG